MKQTIKLKLNMEELYALHNFLSVDFIETIKRNDDIDNVNYIYNIASIYHKCDQIIENLKESE